MLLLGTEWVWRDPNTGTMYPVKELPSSWSQLERDTFYVIGDRIYYYLGEFPEYLKVGNRIIGTFAHCMGEYHITQYPNDPKYDAYKVEHVRSKEIYDFMMNTDDVTLAALDYIDTYKSGDNLVSMIPQMEVAGSIYVPKIYDTDDPLERITKQMVTHMKIVPAEQRTRLPNDYDFDNLVSSLDGATKHMSIAKFLEWCNLLKVDWEFSIYDLFQNEEYPLGELITVSNRDDKWVDIEIPEDKEYFKVKCVPGEDPYKRLIKIAFDRKNIPNRVYRKNGSTPHQINNMKSALKSAQKTTSAYFIVWCELLHMGFSFKLTAPNGDWYKTVGYEMSTNVVERDDKGNVITTNIYRNPMIVEGGSE